ncbi:hypothetical protein GNP82_16315 [Aliivibrio fischeri]|uniref:hypothetical protein n=1 Tax=Aliivibrio fischeri TaxID=668 RepID=UPI0012D9C30C|nr:hypothetical protein [Aliivibrio fischeri]MUK39116.1 hypothetical protein [Aliivibrio fischeri]MUL07893.1 hypothetical protein [Aliivibrio fischeri]
MFSTNLNNTNRTIKKVSYDKNALNSDLSLMPKKNNAQEENSKKENTAKNKAGFPINAMIKKLNIKNIIFKQPNMHHMIADKFKSNHNIKHRFPKISSLDKEIKHSYKQLVNIKEINKQRNFLSKIIGDNSFSKSLEQGAKFGISSVYGNSNYNKEFQSFFDEIMTSSVKKQGQYEKVDFAIPDSKTGKDKKELLLDSRFLKAKLSDNDIIRASYMLGKTSPILTNCRFMHNPPSKSDGKYREWMYHFDNSNYAEELKLISTRKAGTMHANKEQCLAAYPYDTTQNIRFTQDEASTKFSTFNEISTEISQAKNASYVVVSNTKGTEPINIAIRTEMIPHHRSASGKNETEARDAELLTFHAEDRGTLKPYLSKHALDKATEKGLLTPLQRHVLGGFQYDKTDFNQLVINAKSDIEETAESLSHDIVSLESMTVSKFNKDGTSTLINEKLFNRQRKIYDDLPEIIDLLPKTTNYNPNDKKTWSAVICGLMNYDQNSSLQPDLSENLAFPARTFIRERSEKEIITPFFITLDKVLGQKEVMTPQQSFKNMMHIDDLININKEIETIYENANKDKKNSLYSSCQALAKDYQTQIPERATQHETHQTLTLFTYFLLDDLQVKGIIPKHKLNFINESKEKTAKHFVAYRILSQSLKDSKS